MKAMCQGTRLDWARLVANFVMGGAVLAQSGGIALMASRLSAGSQMRLRQERRARGRYVPLAVMAAIALAAFPAASARGQGTTGTYGALVVTGTLSVTGTGTLAVTGTASVGTLAVTGTAVGAGLDVQGNSIFFGSWSTNALEPGVTYSYSEASGGTNAAFTSTLTRPVSTWCWQRLDGFGNAWNVMALDGSNQLILTGTQTTSPGSIIIDPTVGQITINGQTVLTANAIQNLSILSANIGSGNIAGASSIGVGTNVTASGTDSSAFGYGSTASGAYSFAAGIGTVALAYDSVALGAYNIPSGSGTGWVATDPLFTIGNGSGSTSLSSALTVLKNGNVGIGSAAPVARLGVYSPGTTDLLSLSSATGRLATFDSNGYLGIGQSDTGYPLFLYKGSSNAMCVLQVGDATTTGFICQNSAQAYQVGLNVGGPSGFGVYSQTSGAVRLLVANATGNVGIGTVSPLSKLDVNGSVAAGAYAGTAAAPANGMIVSGSVGIGTSSPQATLDVKGPVMVSGTGSAVLINPQGDLSMGPFTSGTIPQ